jgi:hypothetical protein
MGLRTRTWKYQKTGLENSLSPGPRSLYESVITKALVIPVILAIQEAEIRKIVILNQPGLIVKETIL